ncbi:MAG TPA: hypothetical protein PLO93_01815 [Candidatus Omnitrophota bacterium]|nr:hypothetical protein [Candidatus Omnitrophota bacterium]HQL41017.1 hypothetical protein [Candidatus Omnitrophota bacterium]
MEAAKNKMKDRLSMVVGTIARTSFLIYCIVVGGGYWFLRFGLFGNPQLTVAWWKILFVLCGGFVLLGLMISALRDDILLFFRRSENNKHIDPARWIIFLGIFILSYFLLIWGQGVSQAAYLNNIFRNFIYSPVPRQVKIIKGSYHAWLGEEVSVEFGCDLQTFNRILLDKGYTPLTSAQKDKFRGHFFRWDEEGFSFYCRDAVMSERNPYPCYLFWNAKENRAYFFYTVPD